MAMEMGSHTDRGVAFINCAESRVRTVLGDVDGIFVNTAEDFRVKRADPVAKTGNGFVTRNEFDVTAFQVFVAAIEPIAGLRLGPELFRMR